jgi:trigger factor
LQIEKEYLEDHQVKLTVELESDSLEGAKRRAARKISKRTKIPGFRPGKAPFPVVQRHVGEAAVLEEALDILIDELYPKVIDESEISPFGPGRLENFPSADPPVFEFLVPLAPEVELGDYQSVRFDYEPKEVTEKDIEDVINQIRDNQAILETVERPAAEGDVVYLTLSATGTSPEDEEDPKEVVLIPERRPNILIRPEDSDDETEWPFTGFSRHLIDLSAGDTHTLSHTYSEDEQDEALRGQTAEFSLSIDEIKSRELPEINDELAQSMGDYETLADLNTYIQETLETNTLREYDSDYDDRILDEIIEQSEIKYPPPMVDQEVDVLLDQLRDRLENQKLDLDIYLKSRDLDMDGLREELSVTAEERIQRGLVIMEVSSAEKIKVDPVFVSGEVSRTIDQITQILPEREARRTITDDAILSLSNRVRRDRIAELTMLRLRDIAKGILEEDQDSESVDETDETPAEDEMLVTESAAIETEVSEDAETDETPAEDETLVTESAAIEAEVSEESETIEAEQSEDTESISSETDMEETTPETEEKVLENSESETS